MLSTGCNMLFKSVITKVLDANGDGKLSDEELSLKAFLKIEEEEQKDSDEKKCQKPASADSVKTD